MLTNIEYLPTDQVDGFRGSQRSRSKRESDDAEDVRDLEGGRC